MIAIGELLSAEALRRYDDSGDPVYSTFERVLIAMRWFDWCSADRLIEALGLDDADRVERQRYLKAIYYWVKSGRLERRGTGEWSEYRLRHPREWATASAEVETCRRCPAPREAGSVLCQRHKQWQADNKRARRAA